MSDLFTMTIIRNSLILGIAEIISVVTTLDD